MRMTSALRSPNVRTAAAVCGLGLLLASAVGVVLKGRAVAAARETAAWPSVRGVVTRAGIVETAPGGRYLPDVTYAYAIAGREYVGDRVRVSARRSLTRRAAERAAGEFAAGEPVRVYYDPEDPRRSVLRPGAEPDQYALLAALFAAGGLGAALLAVLRRNPSGPSPRSHLAVPERP